MIDVVESRLNLSVNKVHIDKGAEQEVKDVNDLVDIGIFATPQKDSAGLNKSRPLQIQKVRLSSGTQVYLYCRWRTRNRMYR